MSFKLKNKGELIQIGNEYDLMLLPEDSKEEMLNELEKEGVTFEGWTAKVEKQQADRAEMLLIRMDRANASYNIFDVTFTQDHPYAILNREQADHLLDQEEGFRLASPSEAEKYYS